MKKGKHILSAVLALCIALGASGCNTVKKGDRTFSSDPYKAETEVETEAEIETETVAETETETEPTTVETEEVRQGDDVGTGRPTLPDEQYLSAVPEQDRYMFMSGTCTTTFPDNSEIKKISFFKLNYDMCWKCVYGSVDLENGKATYGMSDGLYPPLEYQVYDITPEEVTIYRNGFDSSLLHDEVELSKGYWKVAVEYNDGTCYAYQFDISGSTNHTPENYMLNSYFELMDLDDNTRYIFGLWGN